MGPLSHIAERLHEDILVRNYLWEMILRKPSSSVCQALEEEKDILYGFFLTVYKNGEILR